MAAAAKGLDKLVEESTYVFKATVTQLNASNEPAVRPGPGLIVAHVDDDPAAGESAAVEPQGRGEVVHHGEEDGRGADRQMDLEVGLVPRQP